MRNISSRKLNAGLVALAAFSSVLVTGCSSEGIIDPVSKERVAMQLKASIGDASSRSESTDIRETAFKVGDVIQIPIARWDANNSSWTVFATHTYTVSDSNGNLSSTNPYYLEESDSICIVGLFPAGKYPPVSSFSTQGLNTAVESDQSSDEGYEKSDAIISSMENLTYDSHSTSLKFNHIMCKIKMELFSNYYTAEELKTAVVTLKEILPSASFPPIYLISKGSATANGTAVDITAKNSDNVQTTVCCIIPPQTIKAGKTFFQITIGTDTYSAVLDANNDVKFQSSKVYSYNLHIDRHQMSVTNVSITGWSPISTTPTDIYLKD